MTIKFIKKLCTPAFVYLVISAIAMFILIIQNGGNEHNYCVGQYECQVPSTRAILLIEFLYIAFWTFVLDTICKTGYKQFSWFLVIFPFLLFFVLMGIMMVKQGSTMM